MSAPTAAAVASHVNAAVRHAFTPSLEGTQDAVRAGQFVMLTQEAMTRADSAVRAVEGLLERAGTGLGVAATAATRERDRGIPSALEAVDYEPPPAAPHSFGAIQEKRTPPHAGVPGPGQAAQR
ncbi:hypothetical protein [Segeticoccus rhizosphaerae]|uniref:hypothetical protein n=1 Tax=Segeticoccus rhizosphaerae TaxID=1104777 RepID=UPI0010C007E0|nr:hypothetical protein [Ornithinicoccus soli]